jgi:predicted phosphodiesterase
MKRIRASLLKGCGETASRERPFGAGDNTAGRKSMGRIRQTRNKNLSLWQSAMDEVVARTTSGGAAAFGEAPAVGVRPDTDDPAIAAVTNFALEHENEQNLPPPPPAPPPEVVAAGVGESVLYCSGLALKLAGGLIARIVTGNRPDMNRYKDELRAKFGSCDVKYAEAVIRYAEFVAGGGKIPYRRHTQMSDFVINDKLSNNALIGVVGDWGTGQDDAKQLLVQVRQKNPNVMIHLGDIYYSGTQFEVDNYFYNPWRGILKLDQTKMPTYTLSGNHDMYSGGEPYYKLLDKLGQPASYFCLRNQNWQLLAMDTGKNSNDGGPTHLESTEVDWLRDKISSFGGRTILMSHHQLFSANEDVQDGQPLNLNLYRALGDLLPKVDLWLWGHEHNLVIFDEYVKLKRGRCVGCSAFPVGVDEPAVRRHPEVPVKAIVLGTTEAFYQHGYATIQLNGDSATVSYYQDSAPNQPLFVDNIP